MKSRNLILIVFLSCFFALPVNAAVFNATDGLINIPTVERFRPEEWNFGISGAYTGAKVFDDSPEERYEFDYKVNYSFDENLQLGLNLTNSERAVGHIQYNLTRKGNLQQIAIGIQNIANEDITTWDKYEMDRDFSFSPYIVSSMKIYDNLDFHIGYGYRRFQYEEKHPEEFIKFLQSLDGLFLGLDYQLDYTKFMIEFDGIDMNFGMRLFITPQITVDLALTELFLQDNFNPNYNNAPRRYFTFGMSFRNVFAIDPAENQRIRILNEKIETLEQMQADLEQTKYKVEYEKKLTISDAKKYPTLIDKTGRKKIRFSDKLNTNSLDDKIAYLYSLSFEFYVKEDYGNAIRALNEGIDLDPDNPILYTRLGSIYYELGDYNQALIHWKHALKQNPNNQELKAAIKAVELYYFD